MDGRIYKGDLYGRMGNHLDDKHLVVEKSTANAAYQAWFYRCPSGLTLSLPLFVSYKYVFIVYNGIECYILFCYIFLPFILHLYDVLFFLWNFDSTIIFIEFCTKPNLFHILSIERTLKLLLFLFLIVEFYMWCIYDRIVDKGLITM